MFVGDKNENILNFGNMACQCDDAIPGSLTWSSGPITE
jgi:hypothetical protein